MENRENIEFVLSAIESVKAKIKAEYKEGNGFNFTLMQDLIALENCLVTEVTKALRKAA